MLTAEGARDGEQFQFHRETQADQWWRAKATPVRMKGRAYRLVVAINQATAEVKYFVTNATGEPLRRVLAVAFRRATVSLIVICRAGTFKHYSADGLFNADYRRPPNFQN